MYLCVNTLNIEVWDMDDAAELVLRWPWKDVEHISGMEAPIGRDWLQMDTTTWTRSR